MTGQRADPGADPGPGRDVEAPYVRVRLDELLGKRGMTLAELSARVGVTVVNLSILKNGRARAIRFSTLARLCEALHCQPGDLLGYEPPAPPAPGRGLPVPARAAGVRHGQGSVRRGR